MSLNFLKMLKIFLLSILVLFSACKKGEKPGDDIEVPVPEIQTTTIGAINPVIVKMEGHITNTGNVEISDHGFIYGTNPEPSVENGTKLSLGAASNDGGFIKEVKISVSSPVIYCKAYIGYDGKVIYGKTLSVTMTSVTSKGALPDNGKSGDLVQILGPYAKIPIETVNVFFGNIEGRVVEIRDTSIVVEVPSGIPGHHDTPVNVRLKVGEKNTTISEPFYVTANIKDFTPKSGPVGTHITFLGDNLPDYSYTPHDLFILQDGQNAWRYIDQTYGIAITNDAKEKIKFAYKVGKTVTEIPGEFIIPEPTITEFVPATAMIWDPIVVKGTNLPVPDNGYEYPTLKIGPYEFKAGPAAQGNRTFIIDKTLLPGAYDVSMTTGPHTVTAPMKIKIFSPEATGVSPTAAVPGNLVTITGKFIKNHTYTVYFSDAAMGTANATSESELVVQVPFDAEAATVILKLYTEYGLVPIPGNFTVKPKIITSFSPLSGKSGTLVTIKGEGFSGGIGQVHFGERYMATESLTFTEAKVRVPDDMPEGPVDVYLNLNGQLIKADQKFTVIK